MVVTNPSGRGGPIRSPEDDPVTIYRNTDPFYMLVQLVHSRTRFANTTGNFYGRRVKYTDGGLAGDIWGSEYESPFMSDNSKTAFIFDRPDYAVFVGSTPMLWHSTTREVSVKSWRMHTWVYGEPEPGFTKHPSVRKWVRLCYALAVRCNNIDRSRDVRPTTEPKR